MPASGKKRYAIHYDVEFKPHFKKSEGKGLSGELYELLRKVGASVGCRPKIEDEFITLKVDKNDLSVFVESYLHFDVDVDHPSVDAIKRINQVSKEVLAFASAQTNHSVDSVILHLEADTPTAKRVVGKFVNTSPLAQFNSSLKINADPSGVSFSSVEGGAEILYILLDDKRNPWGSVIYDKVQKELPWELPALISEEIDKRTAKLANFAVR